MRAWFYPGDNFGQEFAYPKNMSAQIAAVVNMPVPTVAAASAEEHKTAPVTATDQTGNSATLEASTYTPPAAAPAPEPAPAPAPAVAEVQAAPAPEPQPAPAPAELPQTSSAFPLIGLLGLLSMVAFFAIRPARVR
jgi:hypothetical protein